jgi:hypothetical protein
MPLAWDLDCLFSAPAITIFRVSVTVGFARTTLFAHRIENAGSDDGDVDECAARMK